MITADTVFNTLFAAPATAATITTDTTLVALQQSGAPRLPGTENLPEVEPLPHSVRDALLRENSDALKSVSGINYDVDRAQAVAVGALEALRIPAATDQGVIPPSSLRIFIDAAGNRVSVIETAFYAHSEHFGRAVIYTDGELTGRDLPGRSGRGIGSGRAAQRDGSAERLREGRLVGQPQQVSLGRWYRGLGDHHADDRLRRCLRGPLACPAWSRPREVPPARPATVFVTPPTTPAR